MIKFILARFRRTKPLPTTAMRLAWIRDPLSHPALEAMSERELGDLPFQR